MMNMFIIIITFLMTTAVFAKTAIIDVFLPSEGGGGGQATAEMPVLLTVSVTGKGFDLGGVGGGRSVPKKDGKFDYARLSEELFSIKSSYPRKEDVVLMFPPEMSYDIVVKVMDASREMKTEKGTMPLFPQVSLGEVQ